jgi:uncharacterized protein (UPF0333 family)
MKERGQVAVEYILLVAVAVVVALIITTAMVSREEGNEGFLIQAWRVMLDTLGADKADDIAPPTDP